MFTCVKLKNFKSFNDITLDLTDKNNRPKSLVLIYGENGIGKSNLASAFYMLSETLRTMEFRDLMQEIFNNKPKNISDSELRSLFTSRFKDIETLINENKTVDSTENLYMEFHLDIKGKNAKYILEMNNSEIVHESLDCILAKNKGHAIDISPKRAFLSEKIFKDKSIIDDFKLLIDKFWGKHSFLRRFFHSSLPVIRHRFPSGQIITAINNLPAAQLHQPYLLFLPRFKTHTCPGGNIQPKT